VIDKPINSSFKIFHNASPHNMTHMWCSTSLVERGHHYIPKLLQDADFNYSFFKLFNFIVLWVWLSAWHRGGDLTFCVFNFKRLECDSLLGNAVATTPKGRRTAAPPLGTPAAPYSAEHSITN